MARTRSQSPNGAQPLGFEATLWSAADTLRGSMDAAEYKHVVLGLIFLKYISDSFEARHAELQAAAAAGADPEDPDEYRSENVFWVPPEARWQRLQDAARQAAIGQLVDAAMEAIERDNPRLKGVLPKDYGRPGLDKRRLGELIDMIGTATRHLRAVVPGYAVNLTREKGLTFHPAWANGREFGRKALSDGTGDQFYFAVRVALAEVLLGDLRPPLILDDPFRYCDPVRRAALHGLLGILAEDRQILYFTIGEPEGLEVTHRMPLSQAAAIDLVDAEPAQAERGGTILNSTASGLRSGTWFSPAH